jgi:hypothetical protein
MICNVNWVLNVRPMALYINIRKALSELLSAAYVF